MSYEETGRGTKPGKGFGDSQGFWGRLGGPGGCPTPILPSQMEVAPLHCTVDITQKRRLFKNTKEIEKM